MFYLPYFGAGFILIGTPDPFFLGALLPCSLPPVPSYPRRRRQRTTTLGGAPGLPRRSAAFAAREAGVQKWGGVFFVSFLSSLPPLQGLLQAEINNIKEFTPLNFVSGIFPHKASRGPGRGSIPSQVLGH